MGRTPVCRCHPVGLSTWMTNCTGSASRAELLCCLTPSAVSVEPAPYFSRCLSAVAHSFGVAPFPIPNLRHVFAVLVDVLLVLDQFVLELLLQVDAFVASPRHAVDGVHYRSEERRVGEE